MKICNNMFQNFNKGIIILNKERFLPIVTFLLTQGIIILILFYNILERGWTRG